MTGVTWNERKPGDWLASNGRWYPEYKYPRAWSTLALPPAPGHGGVSDLHDQNVTQTATFQVPPFRASASASSSDVPPPRRTASRARSTDVARTGRRVADATATNVRTYKHRIERGQAAPAALPPESEWRDQPNTPTPEAPLDAPPPPGRVVSSDQPVDHRNESPPPPPVLVERSAGGRARTQPTAVASAAGASYVNDLGRVLGKARKRIEEAIEESARAGNDRG